MTATKINRRTALLGSVTLPAALAPLGMATAQIAQSEPDPAVLAYRQWLDALTANNADPNDNDTPEGASSWERYRAAEEVMFDVVPTTPEGLACKARFTAQLGGDLRAGGDPPGPRITCATSGPTGRSCASSTRCWPMPSGWSSTRPPLKWDVDVPYGPRL